MSPGPSSREMAQRRVQNFARRFPEALDLACHAALPVVLNAELVHLLRTHFFLDPPQALPYTAEADFLLSPLCQEIGDGLYEVEPDVRHLLLEQLAQDPRYGRPRLREVASLLWQFSRRYAPWADRPILERAQQLTALNFLAPERARQWLDEAEVQAPAAGEGGREWFVAMRKEVLSPTLAALTREQEPASSSDARIFAHVFLLGDAAAGKTALGSRFSLHPFRPTPSTHGANLWHLSMPGGLGTLPSIPAGTVADLTLWDLGGMPNYRQVYPLFLENADAVLLVYSFDAPSDPLRGVHYWATVLRNQARPGTVTYLVAARSDMGTGPAKEEVRRVLSEYGLQGQFRTSALTGEGVNELRQALWAGLAWDRLPGTIGPALVHAVRRLVLEWQGSGRTFVWLDEVWQGILARQPELQPNVPDLEAALASPQMRGLVYRLDAVGPARLLLGSHWIDLIAGCASALLQQAREHPGGQGIVQEPSPDAPVRLPGEDRLGPDEKQALLGYTVELLLRRELCYRQDGQLVFPSHVQRLRPAESRPPVDVTYEFTGSAEAIFPWLVVRLRATGDFQGTLLWRGVAEFARGPHRLGYAIEQGERGEGKLAVYFSPDAGNRDRLAFARAVAGQLRTVVGNVREYLHVYCSRCGTEQGRAVVEARRRKGRRDIICPACDTRLPLPLDLEERYAGGQAAASKETGKRRALLIGCANYRDPLLAPLEGPTRDAQTLAQVLQDPAVGGFDVRVLLDPRLEEVLSALGALVADSEPGDSLLFYFSGHGVLDRAGRAYLAMPDFHPPDVFSEAISANDLREALTRSRSRQQVILLDCAYAGAFPLAPLREMLPATEGLEGQGRTIAVLGAAGPQGVDRQTTTPGGVHGLFSAALVRGLETGEADRNRDGQITVRELAEYVRARLQAEGANQEPVYHIVGADDLIIARSRRGGGEPEEEFPLLRRALVRLGLLGETDRLPPFREEHTGPGGRDRTVVLTLPGGAGGSDLVARFVHAPAKAERLWKRVQELRERGAAGGLPLPLNADHPEDQVFLYRSPSPHVVSLGDFLRRNLLSAPAGCERALSLAVEALQPLHKRQPGTLKKANTWARFFPALTSQQNVLKRAAQAVWPDVKWGRGLTFRLPDLLGGRELPDPLAKLRAALRENPMQVKRSLVHGDLHLSNVLVTKKEDGAPDSAFLIDFAAAAPDMVTAIDFARLESDFWKEVYQPLAAAAGQDESACLRGFVALRDRLDGRSGTSHVPEGGLAREAARFVSSLRSHYAHSVMGLGAFGSVLTDFHHCLYFVSLSGLTSPVAGDDPVKVRLGLLEAALALQTM